MDGHSAGQRHFGKKVGQRQGDGLQIGQSSLKASMLLSKPFIVGWVEGGCGFWEGDGVGWLEVGLEVLVEVSSILFEI